MKDHRKLKRWQINWDAKVRLGDAEASVRCVVNDLSFLGCRLTFPLKLPLDKFIKLGLVLSKNLCLDIEVWVVWHRAIDGFNTYGLYFSKIKDSDKERIYEFIRQNFPHKLNGQWWRGIRKEGGEMMPDEKFEDHRIFERFKAKFPLSFIDLKQSRESDGSTWDVSAKGVGFTCNQELRPRTPLEMWLKIPDKGEPLYTRGEVVWSKKEEPNNWRVGVNLEKADLMGLSRVLRLT